MDVNYKGKVIYAERKWGGDNRRHYSLFLMHISHPFILAHMLNVSLCKIARNTGGGRRGGVIYLRRLINASYICKKTQSRMSRAAFVPF